MGNYGRFLEHYFRNASDYGLYGLVIAEITTIFGNIYSISHQNW